MTKHLNYCLLYFESVSNLMGMKFKRLANKLLLEIHFQLIWKDQSQHDGWVYDDYVVWSYLFVCTTAAAAAAVFFDSFMSLVVCGFGLFPSSLRMRAQNTRLVRPQNSNDAWLLQFINWNIIIMMAQIHTHNQHIISSYNTYLNEPNCESRRRRFNFINMLNNNHKYSI